MRTTEAILAEIRQYKTCSKQQLYRYFARFSIAPLGVRQRPRLYPDDAARRILLQLGLVEGPTVTVKSRIARPHVVSMRALRAERRKAERRAA